MFEATVNEFPFVAEVPRREKSRLTKVWDVFQELKAITEEKGMLVPARMTANLLNISHQRVMQLVETQHLERVTVDKQVFITERSIVAHASSERKAGRPFKLADTKQTWDAAMDYATSLKLGKHKK